MQSERNNEPWVKLKILFYPVGEWMFFSAGNTVKAPMASRQRS